MKPIEFEGQNTVFAKDQPEYQPLPALAVGDSKGTIITCWQLDEDDVEAILANDSRLWLSQLTFGQALQPQLPTANCPFTLAEKPEELEEADIVVRLRWDQRYTNGHVPVTMEDAALEIERLRLETERLRLKVVGLKFRVIAEDEVEDRLP